MKTLLGKTTVIVLALIFVCALSACSGSTDTAAPTAAPTEAQAVTDAPTAEATAFAETPAPTDTPAPTEPPKVISKAEIIEGVFVTSPGYIVMQDPFYSELMTGTDPDEVFDVVFELQAFPETEFEYEGRRMWNIMRDDAIIAFEQEFMVWYTDEYPELDRVMREREAAGEADAIGWSTREPEAVFRSVWESMHTEAERKAYYDAVDLLYAAQAEYGRFFFGELNTRRAELMNGVIARIMPIADSFRLISFSERNCSFRCRLTRKQLVELEIEDELGCFVYKVGQTIFE